MWRKQFVNPRPALSNMFILSSLTHTVLALTLGAAFSASAYSSSTVGRPGESPLASTPHFTRLPTDEDYRPSERLLAPPAPPDAVITSPDARMAPLVVSVDWPSSKQGVPVPSSLAWPRVGARPWALQFRSRSDPLRVVLHSFRSVRSDGIPKVRTGREFICSSSKQAFCTVERNKSRVRVRPLQQSTYKYFVIQAAWWTDNSSEATVAWAFHVDTDRAGTK